MSTRSTWDMIMGLEEEERTRDRLASSVSVLTEAMNEGSVRCKTDRNQTPPFRNDDAGEVGIVE